MAGTTSDQVAAARSVAALNQVVVSGSSGISIETTNQFLRSYQKASPGLQWLIEGATHDLVRGIEYSPLSFLRKYDRLATDTSVLEVNVTGQHRLLATYSNSCVKLLAVGDHRVVSAFGQNIRTARRAGPTTSAPERFSPQAADHTSSLFLSDPDPGFVQFGPEFEPEWAYFLSEEQQAVENEIFNAYETIRPGRNAVFIVLGGPGTGKTSILLKLLKDFWEYRGLLNLKRVGLQCSDRLAQYTDACLPDMRVNEFRRRVDETPAPEVFLLDDPNDLSTINRALREVGGSQGVRLLVIAMDPQQLEDTISDVGFETLTSRAKAERRSLSTCYRQKAKVGRAAGRAAVVIAKSTPYLDEGKVRVHHRDHRDLTRLANTLTYPNPKGYVATYPKATKRLLEDELARIRNYHAWTHWPGLLAFLDYEIRLPTTWMQLLSGVGAEVTRRENTNDIKGLEYQHVFLFLSSDTFIKVNIGFAGSGRAPYLRTRLLRIPYSRAKDSLVTFVVG